MILRRQSMGSVSFKPTASVSFPGGASGGAAPPRTPVTAPTSVPIVPVTTGNWYRMGGNFVHTIVPVSVSPSTPPPRNPAPLFVGRPPVFIPPPPPLAPPPTAAPTMLPSGGGGSFGPGAGFPGEGDAAYLNPPLDPATLALQQAQQQASDQKKWLIWGGIGAAALVVGVLVFRR